MGTTSSDMIKRLFCIHKSKHLHFIFYKFSFHEIRPHFIVKKRLFLKEYFLIDSDKSLFPL